MFHLFTPSRVTPHRGCTSAAGRGKLPWQPFGTLAAGTIPPPSRRGHRDLLGHGPHQREQLTGHRDHDLMRVFPPGAELPRACAQADLCLPTRVLDRRGELCQAAWQVPTHGGRVARGPGPFDQSPTGLGIPRRRDASLASARATGRFRWRQASIMHEWSGVLDTGEVAEFGDSGDRPRQRHATEGWERVNHRAEPPGGDPLVECLVKTLEPCGVLGDRPDICLADDWLGGGGPDDLAEPAPVRRAPGGPTGRPDIMPPQKGFQAKLGRLAIVERIFTRTAQITQGVVCDRWDIDRGAIPRAHQPRQVDRITTVGFHAVAGLFGHEGGRDDPADMAWFRQIAREPRPTGARLIDEDQVCGFGLPLAHELIKVAWPRANGAQVDDRSVVIVSDRGHSAGVLVDSQPNIKGARGTHG
jgi:hypothetical protein